MMAWLLRLIGGWLPIGTKPFGEWLGKIVWCVGIVMACLIVWNRFTRPTTDTHTQTTQRANEINNFTEQPRVMFGCMRYEAIKR